MQKIELNKKQEEFIEELRNYLTSNVGSVIVLENTLCFKKEAGFKDKLKKILGYLCIKATFGFEKETNIRYISTYYSKDYNVSSIVSDGYTIINESNFNDIHDAFIYLINHKN